MTRWRPTHWAPRCPTFHAPHAPGRTRRVVSSLLLDPRVGDYFVPVVEPLPGWEHFSWSTVQVQRITINGAP